MAALKRAFQILGDPVVEGIPEEQLEKLWELRKLYSKKVSPATVVDHEAAGASTVTIGERMHRSGGTASMGAEEVGAAQPATTRIATVGYPGDQRNTRQVINAGSADAVQPTLKSHIPRVTRSANLLRYGAGATTEINVQRYLTMMKPI
jgi:hypothetical protein